MEHIPFMTNITSFQSEFKAMVNAILTHNSLEKESTAETMHRDLNQL